MTAAISSSSKSNILPTLRYRNAEGATRWLCSAFGFEVQTVARNSAGAIDYVQLRFGQAQILLRAILDSSFDQLMKQPDEIGGAETQSCYLLVENVDIHFAAAQAAGAEIVINLQDFPDSGRGYSCRDPEGHLWSFGSFDPWQYSEPLPDLATGHQARRARVSKKSLALSMLAGGVAAAAAFAGILHFKPFQDDASLEKQINVEVARREQSELAARQATSALASERTAKEGFQRAVQLIETEMAATKADNVALTQNIDGTQQQLAAESTARQQEMSARAQLENDLSESLKLREAAEVRVNEEIEKAKAAAEQGQAERAASEATLSQRIFTFETKFHDEQKLRQTAEAATSKAEAELGQAQSARKRAETQLAQAMETLEKERDARVVAEREADKLREKYASDRRPQRKVVAKAKPAVAVKRRVVAKTVKATVGKQTSTQYDDFYLGPPQKTKSEPLDFTIP